MYRLGVSKRKSSISPVHRFQDSEAYQRHANKRNHPDLKQPTYPLPLLPLSKVDRFLYEFSSAISSLSGWVQWLYRTKAPSRGRYATVSLPKCDHLLQSPVSTYLKWSACAASMELEFANFFLRWRNLFSGICFGHLIWFRPSLWAAPNSLDGVWSLLLIGRSEKNKFQDWTERKYYNTFFAILFYEELY
jgi:hypothetical protein